jgi:hypothetical protein
MSLLRKQTRRGYTHVANDLIDTEGLSFRAKGIAVHLLSKPDDWEIKIEYLMKVGKEGREAIRTALKELAEYGFLMRSRVQDASGQMTTVTNVADYPAFLNVGTVESRILGYEPGEKTDPPENRRSEHRRSDKRTVGTPEVLVTTDKRTTGSMSKRRRKDYNDIPADKPRGSYQPDDYPNL